MKNILILGAAGKDFHVFNTVYRDDPDARVVAFTATQIPNIDGRRYPPALAGTRYPDGVPIHPEADLARLVRDLKVDEAVFAYSDVSYDYIEERRRIVEKAGAKLTLPDPARTMLPSSKPVVAVCAVRTGSGKSQTTRRVAEVLKAKGRRVAVCRHPMPYGDLTAQEVQRFAVIADLAKHRCTIEEMEEYEPHLARGTVVFAGVDYEKILRLAEKEADVVLWDGGNNDTPFFRPDLHIVVADPLRAGHEVTYYPGRVNFEMAHAIVINKMDSATTEAVKSIEANAARMNPKARIVHANSPVSATDPAKIRGKRVVCIEDGPTCTHGDMAYGAAYVAAQRLGAKEILDPRPYAVGTLAATYAKYPTTGKVVPAMGYGEAQVHDLEATVNAVPGCECVIVGTPIDLSRLVRFSVDHVRVTYELEEIGKPDLPELLARF